MEDNSLLKQALDFSNFKQSLAIQKKTLKEKLTAKMTIGYNSGIFKIDHALIAFVKLLIDEGRTTDVVILDSNETPVMVADLIEFKDKIFDSYFSAVTEYQVEFEKIKKSRSVTTLLDIELWIPAD